MSTLGEDNNIKIISQLILKNNNSNKKNSSEDKNKYNSQNCNDVILNDYYKNKLPNNFNNTIYNSKYSISQRSKGLNDNPKEYKIIIKKSNFNSLSKKKIVLESPNIENYEYKIMILKENNNKLKESNKKLILEKKI